MTTGPGDRSGVAADTLGQPALQREFSIGRIIPLRPSDDGLKETAAGAGVTSTDYVSGAGRIDGQPMPQQALNTDFSFILLSFSLLIITALTVSARKSIITGLSYLGFRKQPDMAPPGTTTVLAWPYIMRNIFTMLNVGLFAAVALFSTGVLRNKDPYSFVAMTAIISGSFLAALITRHMVCIIIAEVANLKSLFHEYMIVVYNTWFAIALLLFILTGIIIFEPFDNKLPLIITGLIFVAILLIVRVLRLLIIFNKRHVSVSYFILYLCALEVLPVLITMKVLGIF